MKNLTFKGISEFLRELRKHITAGTYADVWKEVNGKSNVFISSDYTVAGETKRYEYLYQLINALIAKMSDVSDAELRAVNDKLLRVSFLFDRKLFFLLAVKDAEQTVEKPLTETKEEVKIEVAETESTVEQKPATVPAKRGRKSSK